MKAKASSRVADSLIYLMLTLVTLITFLPFLYIFFVSFTDAQEFHTKSIILIPEKWSLSSYRYIMSTKMFIRSLGVSGLLAVVGSVIGLAISNTLAYTLSRKRLLGRKYLLMGIVFTMLFSAGMIPNYILVKNLGLMNTIWALILPALTGGWNIILMKSFFEEIPAELEDAGRIDGCSDFGIYFRIMLPLSLPSLAAFGLFYAVGYWNTYFAGVLYISNETLRPMQVVLQMMLIQASTLVGNASIANELQAEQQLPPETIKMAAVIISTLPILMVYPFLQRYFVQGLTLGSVKG
ncbi:carbohydrate ABC transporter permease [Paenibacillus roseipurpureus]|uniref:Carbohydrate ABC transporter permease n=1 Tax=Paenibacillus roseopurpureus TaxID=2918901 RepID=A0AA96LR05_9BACL|nr:carbohydrate ABC transporter permease [Paenibacillus sp. MBLB1832]WNR45751.1 carbohydrate ABC transporter permease [Paenibacillus sp. MBLB1832]